MAEWSMKFVTFLDTTITIENERLLTDDLYVKAADTHRYLHKVSCHHSHYKQGVPYMQPGSENLKSLQQDKGLFEENPGTKGLSDQMGIY